MVDYSPADLFKIYDFKFEERDYFLNQVPESINFDIDSSNNFIICSDFNEPAYNIDSLLKNVKI